MRNLILAAGLHQMLLIIAFCRFQASAVVNINL